MAFICSICHKSLPTKESKDSHVVMIHEKSGQFACRNCGKKFYRKSNLKRHERIHTGEKPFACEVCQKRFTRKGSLEKHRLNIHGEKKFVCQICSRGFGLKRYLQKHLLTIHSGNKRFKCDLCEYSSGFKHNLKKHQARRHSITRLETSGGRLARDDDREELPVAVEQSNGGYDSGDANYDLRVRSKTPNYSVDQRGIKAEYTGTNPRENSESGANRQDSDREPAEPDEESGLEDELVVRNGVVYRDEQNGDENSSDEPLEVLESNESRAAKEYEVISLSSDNEDGYLPPESSTVISANLTVVYGVEYQAPDESD